MLVRGLRQLGHGADAQAIVDEPGAGRPDTRDIQEIGSGHREATLQILVVAKLAGVQVLGNLGGIPSPTPGICFSCPARWRSSTSRGSRSTPRAAFMYARIR